MNAAQAMLQQAIDYAGLFPPARLDLPTTIENYRTYRNGADAWALGRLVLPVSALAAVARSWPEVLHEWPISILLGDGSAEELQAARFAGLKVEVVEARAASSEQVQALRDELPMDAMVFLEAPMSADAESWVAAAARAGCSVKIRMGGVTPQAIPAASAIAKMIDCCAKYAVRFKATAGLHHALRGERALTYEPDSPVTAMHGFVNVFVAAALLFRGGDVLEAEAALKEERLKEFRVTGERLYWRDWIFTAQQIAEMRHSFFAGFGSCSFTEPLDDLRTMGWLA
jgi:hypothetical protein